ncbi:MAG TPA: hypothetical protein PKD70_15370 [Saprospiraceae bacterium]|nr:hypothetical protein [Saprospiraceae bacterium]HMP15258.1 hypothetical protein [Saprospiraceae bacterium]
MSVKSKLKKIVSETYSWVDDPRGSADFNDDLNITDEELGELKEPIEETFGISIRRKEIKECFDINELTRVIENKMPHGSGIVSNSSGTLWEDLDKYKYELSTKPDIIAGLKIIGRIGGEIGGVITVAALTAKLLLIISGALAPLGIGIGTGLIARYITMTVNAYANMNTEDRRKVRIAIRWIKGTFHV